MKNRLSLSPDPFIPTDVLINKFIPGGTNIASSIGYGSLGGALNGVGSEYLNQASDIYLFNRQDDFNKEDIIKNTILDASGSATGKLYKNIGDMMNSGHYINDIIDIGTSQSFKPTIESYIKSNSDSNK